MECDQNKTEAPVEESQNLAYQSVDQKNNQPFKTHNNASYDAVCKTELLKQQYPDSELCSLLAHCNEFRNTKTIFITLKSDEICDVNCDKIQTSFFVLAAYWHF